jgi:hypothetical protein
VDHQPGPAVCAQKNWRDRLIGLAARHPAWVVGYADEVWWSRLAQPAMRAWGETLRLHAKARAKDDAQPKALACYGLLRTDQDRVLLRFVEGRPVSRVTTDFLAWGADRLAAEGQRVWVLVWDNAAWHVSRAVRAWIGAHNRTVKRTGEPHGEAHRRGPDPGVSAAGEEPLAQSDRAALVARQAGDR